MARLLGHDGQALPLATGAVADFMFLPAYLALTVSLENQYWITVLLAGCRPSGTRLVADANWVAMIPVRTSATTRETARDTSPTSVFSFRLPMCMTPEQGGSIGNPTGHPAVLLWCYI
jgi:hypothetical protein